jgi:hypothetical protein
VQVKNGYFTVTLGEKSDVASIIRARQNIYFDIMVDGKSVYSRLQPLTASPYSVKSSYSLAGEGSPVGIFCAPMGATFIDTSARSLYLKTGAADSSWTKIGD